MISKATYVNMHNNRDSCKVKNQNKDFVVK